jgi:hypothetical protein
MTGEDDMAIAESRTFRSGNSEPWRPSLYRFVNRGEDQTLYWPSIAISVFLGLAMIIANFV